MKRKLTATTASFSSLFRCLQDFFLLKKVSFFLLGKRGYVRYFLPRTSSTICRTVGIDLGPKCMLPTTERMRERLVRKCIFLFFGKALCLDLPITVSLWQGTRGGVIRQSFLSINVVFCLSCGQRMNKTKSQDQFWPFFLGRNNE